MIISPISHQSQMFFVVVATFETKFIIQFSEQPLIFSLRPLSKLLPDDVTDQILDCQRTFTVMQFTLFFIFTKTMLVVRLST